MGPARPLFAVPVATMALGPIALCRRSGARVPAGAAAMLLAGIAAESCTRAACGSPACSAACAARSTRRGARGARGAPGRAAAAAGAAMAPDRRGLGARGIAGAAIGRRGGHAIRDRIGDVPIFSAIYDAGSDALVSLQRRLGVQPARVGGLQGALRHAPPRSGARASPAPGRESAYREIVDVLQGSTSLEESTEDWGWELFLVRDDEADALRSGGHFDELAHGGGYTLFELPEGGE